MRLLATIAICWCLSCEGATYYVDATSGLDGTSGHNGTSTELAWKTLAYVTNQSLSVGDSILLKRGEVWNEPFVFKQNSIVLSDYGSGQLPTIDGQQAIKTLVSCGSVSNTTTRNIRIINAGVSNGALWENSAGSNYLISCFLSNNAYATGDIVAGGGDSHSWVSNCIISAASDDGLTLHTTASMEVFNTVITDCFNGINNSGTDIAMTIAGCTFSNNVVDIGDIGDGTTFTAERCLFSGFAVNTSWTIMSASDADSTAVFSYCVFDARRGASATPGIGIGNNTSFLNCAFVGSDNGSFGISPDAVTGVTNCVFSHWWRLGYLSSGATLNVDHSVLHEITVKNITSETSTVSTSDPLFTDAINGDFTIQSNSPCVNAGINLGFTVDYASHPISGLPDVGAYEYYVAVLSPPQRLGRWKGVTP